MIEQYTSRLSRVFDNVIKLHGSPVKSCNSSSNAKDDRENTAQQWPDKHEWFHQRTKLENFFVVILRFGFRSNRPPLFWEYTHGSPYKSWREFPTLSSYLLIYVLFTYLIRTMCSRQKHMYSTCHEHKKWNNTNRRHSRASVKNIKWNVKY